MLVTADISVISTGRPRPDTGWSAARKPLQRAVRGLASTNNTFQPFFTLSAPEHGFLLLMLEVRVIRTA